MAAPAVVEVVAALLAGGVGLPIPEELALISAGWLIARGEPAWTMCLAALGAVLAGDLVMYTAGRSARLGLVRRLVGERRIVALERSCERYGAKLLLVARFVPGVRAALLVGAGAGRVSLARFFACDGLAAALGATLWIAVGHRIGPRLDEARAIVAQARGGIAIAAVVVVGVVVLVHLRERRATRLQHSCARADAGPALAESCAACKPTMNR